MTQTDNIKDLLVLKGFTKDYDVTINSSNNEFKANFSIMLSVIKK